MKKWLSVMACSLVAFTILAGCGSNSNKNSSASPEAVSSSPATSAASEAPKADPVKIKWAIFETDNFTDALWQSIIDSFEKEYPDIQVEKVLMTGDSRPQFLKTLLAAGSLPDIMLDPAELAKIKDVLAPVPDDLLANFEDGSVPVFNNQKVLVPASKQLRSATYYNKKMFADAGITDVPKTWDEFLAACEKLKAKGITPLITAGASDVWATSFGYWVNVVNPEVEVWNANFNADLKSGAAKWNNPVITDALQKWQDLYKNGYFDKGSLSYSYSQASAEFQKGRAAMMMDGSWVAPSLDKGNLTDFGVFQQPTKDGITSYSAAFNYMAVSNSSKNKDAAFKFLKYFLVDNKDVYLSYIKADGLLSSTKEPVTYEMGPVQTQFVDSLKGLKLVDEITKLPGDNALPTGMEDFTQKSLQSILAGAPISKELDTWDDQYKKLSAATAGN
ncbi:extracellular solute-binding protein [Cohnella endophytica]|uniref:Extracellular solute-binding protein n=1 Tax=Cohnella endophytica TaxID=2419778 RepID=A0A494Y0L2_9BACL|nr:extracellular solute-binding protein [Cohnella endophytica]RKP56296.1 extracellular solute-binding protein [Cohnella endophytica]